MTINRRRSFRPWARRVPAFVLRPILVALALGAIPGALWNVGLKELWEELVEEWQAAGDPIEKKDAEKNP